MKTVCKKLFSLLLVAVLLVSVVPFQASADTIKVGVAVKLTDDITHKDIENVACGTVIRSLLPNGTTMLNELKKLNHEASIDMEFQGWVYTTGAMAGQDVNTAHVISADMANEYGWVGIKAKFGYPEKSITLNANGGSVTPGSVKVDRDGYYPELPVPTRPGYSFNGWYTANTDQRRDTGNPVTSYENLVAKWVIGTFKVTFQDWSESGKEFVDSSIVFNVTNGKSLNEHKAQNGFTLPEPNSFTARAGYSFSETTPWVDENGNAVNFDTKITRDMKIRPNYVANTYKMTYDYECEELANETVEIKFGSIVNLKQPTRANFVFRGWLVVQDNYKELKTGDTYNYGDITLVAQWAPKGTVELRVYRDDTDDFKTFYYSGAILGGELDLNECKIQNYLKGTYSFDGWYDYNGWVSYLGTRSTKGVEEASNSITRLEKITTSNTGNSTVTVIYGMVKGYKATTGTNNNGNNNVNTGTPDPSNPQTGDTIMIAVSTMAIAAAALVAMYELKKRKMI